MELVASYKVNKGEISFTVPIIDTNSERGEVGVDFIEGPSRMKFFNDNLVIEDTVNRRTFYLNDKFEIEKVLDKYDPENISFKEYEGFKFDYSYNFENNSLSQYDKDWNLILTFPTKKIGIQHFSDYLFYDDTLFIWDEKLNLTSISPFVKDRYRENLRNEVDTIEYIKSTKYGNSKWKNFKIDTDGRIFIDGLLKSNKYSEHYFFWQESYPDRFKMKPNKVIALNYNYRFIGYDSNDLFYWRSGEYIQVIDFSNGTKVKLFNAVGATFKIAAVNTKGDLFFFDYDENEARLYRIKRQW